MNIINWFITSSADPKRTSLALKGVLVLGGTYLLHTINLACGIGLYCIGIDQNWINTMIEQLTFAAELSLMLVGIAVGIVGMARKITIGRWSALH